MATSTPLVRETEREFQGAVIDLAHTLGWLVAHFRPALTKRGWRTPVQADGAGFLDLLLARERLVFAELKTHRGKLSPKQGDWIAALESAGAEVYVWRSADWDSIVETLRRRTETR